MFAESGNINFGLPAILSDESRSTTPASTREPNFETSDFSRLLHVLADTKMLTEITLLMEPRTRAELESEPVDP